MDITLIEIWNKVDGAAHNQMVEVVLYTWWWIIGFHQNLEFLCQERNLLPPKKGPAPCSLISGGTKGCIQFSNSPWDIWHAYTMCTLCTRRPLLPIVRNWTLQLFHFFHPLASMYNSNGCKRNMQAEQYRLWMKFKYWLSILFNYMSKLWFLNLTVTFSLKSLSLLLRTVYYKYEKESNCGSIWCTDHTFLLVLL